MCIAAQCGVGHAAKALAIQKTIDPINLTAAGLLDNAKRAACVVGGGAGGRHGTSWASSLQQRLELACIAFLDEEAVRIVTLGQPDPASV